MMSPLFSQTGARPLKCVVLGQEWTKRVLDVLPNLFEFSMGAGWTSVETLLKEITQAHRVLSSVFLYIDNEDEQNIINKEIEHLARQLSSVYRSDTPDDHILILPNKRRVRVTTIFGV